MNQCLKCGKEIPVERAFCEDCVAVMEQHPIAPGTPVLIPKRPSAPKNTKRKRQTQAETIRKLYRKLRAVTYLCILFAALVVTLSVLLFLSVY